MEQKVKFVDVAEVNEEVNIEDNNLDSDLELLLSSDSEALQGIAQRIKQNPECTEDIVSLAGQVEEMLSVSETRYNVISEKKDGQRKLKEISDTIVGSEYTSRRNNLFLKIKDTIIRYRNIILNNDSYLDSRPLLEEIDDITNSLKKARMEITDLFTSSMEGYENLREVNEQAKRSIPALYHQSAKIGRKKDIQNMELETLKDANEKMTKSESKYLIHVSMLDMEKKIENFEDIETTLDYTAVITAKHVRKNDIYLSNWKEVKTSALMTLQRVGAEIDHIENKKNYFISVVSLGNSCEQAMDDLNRLNNAMDSIETNMDKYLNTYSFGRNGLDYRPNQQEQRMIEQSKSRESNLGNNKLFIKEQAKEVFEEMKLK